MSFERRMWLSLGVLTILSMNYAEASSPCGGVATWKDWEPIVQRKDAVEQSGNDAFLGWNSVALLFNPGKQSAVVVADCIANFVENKTDQAVRNVVWPSANYRQNAIPAHDALLQSYTVGGYAPVSPGPLYVGVGRYFEKTTPYSAAVKTGEAAAADGKKELASTIEFVDSQLGEKVTLRFLSTATSLEEGVHRFDYSVTTSALKKGSMKYLVYWYIPLTEEFQRLRINLKSPVTAETGRTAQYSLQSSDQIGWTPAVVQVFDFDLKRWLATGVASAYCSRQGKTETLRQLPENGGN